MDYQEGYVYHIKDEYFIKANDPNLMQNNAGWSLYWPSLQSTGPRHCGKSTSNLKRTLTKTKKFFK